MKTNKFSLVDIFSSSKSLSILSEWFSSVFGNGKLYSHGTENPLQRMITNLFGWDLEVNEHNQSTNLIKNKQ